MSNYWNKRVKEYVKSQNISDEELSNRLIKHYIRTSNEINKQIGEYYLKYGEDNIVEYKMLMEDLKDYPDELKKLIERTDEFMKDYPEYEELRDIRNSIYKLNRLEALQYSTQIELMKLGAIEQKEMEQHLIDTFGKAYLNTAKELGLGKSFLSINSAVARNTIYDKWIDGRNFSDRIWVNKGKLVNQLQTTIRDGFIRGDNYNSLSDLLVKRLNVGFSDAKRLIWTESSFVMNQASAQPYIDAGHTEYRINAIIDNKTSKICRHMHDEVFKFEDRKVGINFPPFHPWCRTMIVGVRAPRTLDDIKDTSEEKQEVTDIPVKYRKFNNVDDIKRYWKEKKGYNEWKDNLSETDLSAIERYTGNDFSFINEILRDGVQSKLNQGIPQYSINNYLKLIEETKGAISGYTVEDDIKVFRGIRGSIEKGYEPKIGDVKVIDKGFMSTSLYEDVTKDFMGESSVLFEIDIPKGSKVGSYMEDVSFYDNEYEFLIKPNTKFKVKEVISDTNPQRIKLEVYIND